MVGKGVISFTQGRTSGHRWEAGDILSPAEQSLWQRMSRKIGETWSSSLVCGAWLSQQWSGACLSYTFRVVHSTLPGLLSKCLGILVAKCGIFPEAYLWVAPLCRRGCSDHMCIYLRCVSMPQVFTLT